MTEIALFTVGIKVLFRTTLAMMKLALTPKDLARCQGYVHMSYHIPQNIYIDLLNGISSVAQLLASSSLFLNMMTRACMCLYPPPPSSIQNMCHRLKNDHFIYCTNGSELSL